MLRRKTFAAFISRCGRPVTVQQEDKTVTLNAYFNPIRERKTSSLPTESGVLDTERWILLAPFQENSPLEKGKIISADGEKFLLERLEKVYYRCEPAYLWGTAVRAQEYMR